MRTDKEVLKRGLRYMLITAFLMFTGPSLLYVALGNEEKPLYIPLLILSLILCVGAIVMGFWGIKTIMDSMFRGHKSNPGK